MCFFADVDYEFGSRGNLARKSTNVLNKLDQCCVKEMKFENSMVSDYIFPFRALQSCLVQFLLVNVKNFWLSGTNFTLSKG